MVNFGGAHNLEHINNLKAHLYVNQFILDWVKLQTRTFFIIHNCPLKIKS